MRRPESQGPGEEVARVPVRAVPRAAVRAVPRAAERRMRRPESQGPGEVVARVPVRAVPRAAVRAVPRAAERRMRRPESQGPGEEVARVPVRAAGLPAGEPPSDRTVQAEAARTGRKAGAEAAIRRSGPRRPGLRAHRPRCAGWHSTNRVRRSATRRDPGWPARARRPRSALPWWPGARTARTRRRRATSRCWARTAARPGSRCRC